MTVFSFFVVGVSVIFSVLCLNALIGLCFAISLAVDGS